MTYLFCGILWSGMIALILAVWPRKPESIHEEEWENDN